MFQSFGDIMMPLSKNKNESSKGVKEFLDNGVIMSPKSQNIVLFNTFYTFMFLKIVIN